MESKAELCKASGAVQSEWSCAKRGGAVRSCVTAVPSVLKLYQVCYICTKCVTAVPSVLQLYQVSYSCPSV